VAICGQCGRDNPQEARFCNGCGGALALAVPSAAEERKVVTVLFADITGSTALGERLDAEALKEVMGAFFAAMRSEIEAEGGTVEKFIGDAIMAAFGVPRVHEDDPARALRAALRMRARLGELNPALAERHGVTLELRIGINTGPVMAVTEPRPGEALATGDAVNAAARLEQAARPGQVLVSERTAQAAPHFRFSQAQVLDLRGRAEPLRAVELDRDQPITEGTLSGSRAPLVGRRRELELLTATYNRIVEEGQPHLVTLYGEAGVGKSRLAGELLVSIEATQRAPRVVRGRCLAYGDGITYWPLAELLKTYAQALDTDSAEIAHARVADAAEAVLAAAGADSPADLAATLAGSIGLAAGEAAARTPQELRAETHFAWRSFFSALAADAPTVVLIEDLHWADPALLELIEDVANHAAGPLFFLCTARPELTARRPTWGGGRRSFTGLAVEPLDSAESGRLAELLLDAVIGERARAEIVERAEGNPFFLEEIVRTRAVSVPGAGSLPDTVHSALAARIDLLPADEKRVLQTAAVVGRVFWPAAVAQVAALEADAVSELLDRLQNRDLVLGRLSSSMSGQRELIFKHALICEVAYESLPRRDRVRMHSDVADWIERTLAGRYDEVAELIAHHRAAAHRAEPSEELRRAAFDVLAYAAAGAYRRAAVERALSLASAALEISATPLERARALETVGLALFVTYDGLASWQALREAADIVHSETPDDHARLAEICGYVTMIPTRGPGLMRSQPPPEEVLPYLELGLACAGERDSPALVRLLASRGYWDFGYGIDPGDASGELSRASSLRAREVARRLDRPDLELVALDALSSSYNCRGLAGLAEPVDEERLVIARTLRDPFEVGDTFYTAAWSALDVGRYPRVLALAAEVEAMAIEFAPIGPRSLAVLARVQLGTWDEALADQARLRELLGATGEVPPSMATGGYGAEAFIYEARGEHAAADAVLAEIGAWMGGGVSKRPWASLMAAVARARRGDFERAWRLLDTLGAGRIFATRELEVRCTVMAEEEAWSGAEELVARSRRHAEEARLLALPLHADRLEGRALLAAGDAGAAVRLLARAAAGFGNLSADWELALTELSLGEALLDAGRGEESAAVLARAAAVLERLRVPRELARARALLVGPAGTS
jgi:class 3 adenylate cyclase